MTRHDVTDPNAPLGWQCGDPGCPDHGVARFVDVPLDFAEAVERIRSHHDRTLRHSPTNRVGYCAEPDGISATYCETGILLAALRNQDIPLGLETA